MTKKTQPTNWTQPPFLLAGSAHPALAQGVADVLHTALRKVELEMFPDGETHVSIADSVRGEHVFILQPTCAPVERNLFELLLMADACRRGGAREITAVIPYFGYARQDRRTTGREAVGARLVLDLIAAAHVDRVVGVDLHTPVLEGFSSVPFEHLSALPFLMGAIGSVRLEGAVVVAPDAGAVKLAERVGRTLDLPTAFVHKARLDGSTVEARRVVGSVAGRTPLIVDDMISTGSTVEAAARLLLEGGCTPQITVLATHGLFVGLTLERLSRLPIELIITSDSVPEAVTPSSLRVQRVPLAGLLAQAISALYLGQSMHLLLARV